VEEGSRDGLGLHVLVLGGVEMFSSDARTGQTVELCSLRDAGSVFGAVSEAKIDFTARAACDTGAITLFIPKQTALHVLRTANKASAYAAMEQFARQRRDDVREAHANRTAAVHRLADRLQLLRRHMTLVVELEAVLLHADSCFRCVSRMVVLRLCI
jgi:hypothetical protein